MPRQCHHNTRRNTSNLQVGDERSAEAVEDSFPAEFVGLGNASPRKIALEGVMARHTTPKHFG
ncbi:MAG: hypothetical protein AAGA55_11765, partial [Planctomycetota bacterium]